MLKSKFLSLIGSCILLSVIFCPSSLFAAKVVSVQSINITPYNDALMGLESACDCNIKQFVLSEMKGINVVKEMRRENPEVIVAIGSGALEKIKEINDIPIVYLMVLNSQSVIAGKGNIAGISMSIAPDRQLGIIRQAFPDISNIGLLYDPDKTGKFVEDVLIASESQKIKVTAGKVESSKDLPGELNKMKGVINALWMLPDVSVVTPEAVEILFLYSLQNRAPVITFSKKYLEMGALMSLDVDAYDMGAQAAEIVKKILSGADIKNISSVSAGKINITINQRIAKKLGIRINNEILKKAVVINQE